jgi:hypothetical protein
LNGPLQDFSMSRTLHLLAVPVFAALSLVACAGKTLDVGTANRSATTAGEAEAAEAAEAAEQEQPSTAAESGPLGPLDEVAGVWVMIRQDGVFGVPHPEPAPPIELELTSSGAAYLSRCARAPGEVVTSPCPPAASLDCSPGTVEPEGARWRVDIPAIRVGNVPEQGETLLMTDGTLLVRYIHPTFSAGYFRRIAPKDQVGGCPR